MSLGLSKLAAAGITSLCLLFNAAGAAATPETDTSIKHTAKNNQSVSEIFKNARGSMGQAVRGTSTQKALEQYKSAIDGKSACIGLATDELLEFADDNNLPEPEVARQIIKDLSKDEIQTLPMKTKINLIKALTSDGVPDGAIQRALIKLYQNTGEDPAFALWDAIKQEQLANVLKNDPQVIKARSNWRSMDKAERVDILQYISDLTIGVYGQDYNMPKVKLQADKLGKNTYGQYKSWLNLIEINLSHPDLDRSFDQSVSTVLHESMHAFHDHIDDLANRNRIAQGDPAYLMAKLMLRSYTFKGYIPSDKSFSGYLSNPTERHANEVGFISRYAGKGHNYTVPDFIRLAGEQFSKDFNTIRDRALQNAKNSNGPCASYFSP